MIRAWVEKIHSASLIIGRCLEWAQLRQSLKTFAHHQQTTTGRQTRKHSSPHLDQTLLHEERNEKVCRYLKSWSSCQSSVGF